MCFVDVEVASLARGRIDDPYIIACVISFYNSAQDDN